MVDSVKKYISIRVVIKQQFIDIPIVDVQNAGNIKRSCFEFMNTGWNHVEPLQKPTVVYMNGPNMEETLELMEGQYHEKLPF